MNYYYIIEDLNQEYRTGLYGRKKLSEEEEKNLNFNFNDLVNLASDPFFLNSILRKTPILNKILDINTTHPYEKVYSKFSSKKNNQIIHLSSENECNFLVFNNKTLESNYTIDSQKKLFHGLFDDKILKEKDFKIMMESNNQVNLIIVSRKDLPNDLVHFGGKSGVFDLGLYCSHPKNNKVLLPVSNYKQIVEEMVLNEIFRAYQFLGAKQIIIEDVTRISGKSDNRYLLKKGKIEGEFENKILIEKVYGSGIFNPILALESTYFIHDFPSVMNTINSRINGNIISDKIEREINLSLGLDLGIIKLFNSNSNFDYERKWKFDVLFYDKNEIINQ